MALTVSASQYSTVRCIPASTSLRLLALDAAYVTGFPCPHVLACQAPDTMLCRVLDVIQTLLFISFICLLRETGDAFWRSCWTSCHSTVAALYKERKLHDSLPTRAARASDLPKSGRRKGGVYLSPHTLPSIFPSEDTAFGMPLPSRRSVENVYAANLACGSF